MADGAGTPEKFISEFNGVRVRGGKHTSDGLWLADYADIYYRGPDANTQPMLPFSFRVTCEEDARAVCGSIVNATKSESKHWAEHVKQAGSLFLYFVEAKNYVVVCSQ